MSDARAARRADKGGDGEFRDTGGTPHQKPYLGRDTRDTADRATLHAAAHDPCACATTVCWALLPPCYQGYAWRIGISVFQHLWQFQYSARDRRGSCMQKALNE